MSKHIYPVKSQSCLYIVHGQGTKCFIYLPPQSSSTKSKTLPWLLEVKHLVGYVFPSIPLLLISLICALVIARTSISVYHFSPLYILGFWTNWWFVPNFKGKKGLMKKIHISLKVTLGWKFLLGDNKSLCSRHRIDMFYPHKCFQNVWLLRLL